MPTHAEPQIERSIFFLKEKEVGERKLLRTIPKQKKIVEKPG